MVRAKKHDDELANEVDAILKQCSFNAHRFDELTKCWSICPSNVAKSQGRMMMCLEVLDAAKNEIWYLASSYLAQITQIRAECKKLAKRQRIPVESVERIRGMRDYAQRLLDKAIFIGDIGVIVFDKIRKEKLMASAKSAASPPIKKKR